MSSDPVFLVTGTSSGLGQYLAEEFDGVRFRRADGYRELVRHRSNFYDCVIHCATDARNQITSQELLDYWHSHIAFTQRLVRIPHGLFVFISSAAVYPDPMKINSESDPINLPFDPPLYGLYGMFKLLAEQLVSKLSSRPLILRTTAIVGRTSRPNNINQLLRTARPQLSLTGASSYNLVSMSQIKAFIELAIAENLTGVFNVGATSNSSLDQIARRIGASPIFGEYTHNVHLIDTQKIRSVSSDFDKNSLEIAEKEAAKS